MLNVCSQVFIAVVLMIITGMLSNIVWICLYRLMQKHISELACVTLRLVCLLYVFPIGYILINLLKRNGYIQGNHLWQLNFRGTDIMRISLFLFSIVWIGILIFCNIKRHIGERQFISGDFPEENTEAVKEFKRIKRHLKVYGPVSIYRNDMIQGPRIQGLIKGRIILPFRNYTKEQLKVIYSHELIHYKHHDIFFKYCSAAGSGMTKFFKGLTKHRNYMLDELFEYHCDRSTIAAMKEEMNGKEYFTHILDISGKCRKAITEEELLVKLSTDSTQLGRRIAYINEYERRKKYPNSRIIVLTMFFLLFNIVISYSIGYKLSVLNDSIYKKTENIEILEMQQNIDEVTMTDQITSKSLQTLQEVDNKINIASFKQEDTFEGIWEVDAGKCYFSDSLFFQEGKHVALNCLITSETGACRLGIIQINSGETTYIDGFIVFDEVYRVPEDGEYKIFIQNESENKITASVHITYDN